MTLDLRLAPPKRSRLAASALTLAAFSALVTIYAAVLVRARLVEAPTGFATFLVGLALAALAALVAVAALAVVWRSGAKGGGRAFAAIVLSAAVLGGPAYVAAGGAAAPRLTQASTDVADPPRFDRAARDRKPGDLPLPTVIAPAEAEAQAKAYPDLQALKLDLAPEEVANLAAGLVEERGWRMLGRTSFPRGGGPTGRIEAVARTAVLGFEEDVSIRVRAEADGSRVDMRSASRIGAGDFGSNAKRIKAFLADLATAANAAP